MPTCAGGPPRQRSRHAPAEGGPDYQQAIALDSTFADAWAELSGTLSTLYSNSTPDPAVDARAKAAAERALALDPEGGKGQAALGSYYLAVRRDAVEAEKHITIALASTPSDVNLLARAASAERSLGRMDAALGRLQQARRIDPRSLRVAVGLQNVLLWLRRYPEALTASEAALTLAPGDLSKSQDKAMVYVAQGDLPARGS